MIKVSVIIPTFHDWDRLSLCLEALFLQSFPKSKYEIIVVNNDPDDRVPKSFNHFINLKIIPEKMPGSYAARNAALKIAKGEIIGFTDSDCIPDINWIANAVNYLEKNPLVSRVTGPIKIFSKKNRPSMIELYDIVYAFPQKDYVRKGMAVTANLFVYKEVFWQVGDFNAGTMSGGDLEWGFRAHERGYKIEYCEHVLVNHPARDTYSSLFNKAKRVGKGKIILETLEKGKIGHIANYLFVFKPKTGEIKRIFLQEKDLNIFSRIYLLILRHIILWISEIWKLKSGKLRNNKIMVSQPG